MDNIKIRQIGKGIAYAVTILIFCLYSFVFGMSCRTTNTQSIPSPTAQHSIEIGRIQGAIESYGSTIDTITADLSQRAGSLSNSLEELSIYLERYFSGVEYLLQRYGALQKYVSTGSYQEQDFNTYINCVYPLANNPDNP